MKLKEDMVKKVSCRFVMFVIIFVGAISGFVQAQASEPPMKHNMYVGVFAGGSVGGDQWGNAATGSSLSGSPSSSPFSSLTETGGAAGGFNLGYYSRNFGVEIDDIAMEWTIPTQFVIFSGYNGYNGNPSANFGEFTGTRNVVLFNGLDRPSFQTSWGMWYPYFGVGVGFDGGTTQQQGAGAATYTVHPSWAGDFKLGAATVWQSGWGLFAEYQAVLSGVNLSNTFQTQSGPATSTLTGVSFNNVLDVGMNYNFKL